MTDQNSNVPIRLLIVDDHFFVRMGLAESINDEDNLEVVAEAGNSDDALAAYREHRPDIVLMDLKLPGKDGVETIAAIREEDEAARIIMLSVDEGEDDIHRSVQAGARGYVSKSSAPGQLVEAVQQVADGGVYLPAAMAQQIALNKIRGGELPVTALSTREFEIFRLLASGKTPGDIARQLSLSTKTVANYSTQIKNKLRVSSLAELARVAIRHGFVDA